MKHESVFDTIKAIMRKGYTFEEAVEFFESATWSKIPEELKDRIRGEINASY